jgi:hypothetical protein
MKKTIFTIFISVIYLNLSFSQALVIDAGADKYICMNSTGLQPGSSIGGNPTIISGVPPFEIKWETQQSIGSAVFTASDFLNDTTATNPLFIDFGFPPMTFYITIKDSLNQIAKDTIIVNLSSYSTIPEPNIQYITAGDTTIISPNLFGGVPPISYSWSPNYNISDTSSSMPSVWPTQSTTYQCTITDAVGCVNTENLNYATVNVWPVNTKETLIKSLKVYPNPTQDYLTIELDNGQIHNLRITDISGKVILKQIEIINKQIDISHLVSGIYILIVEDKKGNVGNFQILKR